MIISKTFLMQFILVILAKFFLEYLYIFVVHPSFEYAGFKFELDLFKYVFGWCTYIFTYLILYSKKELNISEIYFFIFLLWFLPNIVFYGLSNQDTIYFISLSLPFIIIILFTFQNTIFKLPQFSKGKIFILIISLSVVLLVMVNYYLTTGGKIVLNFSQVYDFRNEFGELSTSGVFGYLNSWASKIFVVVLLSWSIYKKKYLYIILSFIMVFLLFALSGHKGVLSSIFLVVFF